MRPLDRATGTPVITDEMVEHYLNEAKRLRAEEIKRIVNNGLSSARQLAANLGAFAGAALPRHRRHLTPHTAD